MPHRALRFVALCILLTSSASWASEVAIEFDVSPMVGCVDVTDEAFVAEFPGEKLWKASFYVSALAQRGSIADVIEIRYDLVAPEQQLVVYDYSPKTTLASDVVGNIEIETSKQQSKSASLSAGGRYGSYVNASVDGGGETAASAVNRYALKPQQDTIATAGTIRRRSGVYFKWKASSQTTLEGGRDIEVLFRSPRRWQGDYVWVACRAVNRRGKLVGKSSYLVPLYDRQDPIGKKLAWQLHLSERSLLAASVANRPEIQRISRPTVAHEIDILHPEIPTDWLQQALKRDGRVPVCEWAYRLPEPVRAAIVVYQNSLAAMLADRESSEASAVTLAKGA